MEQKKRIITVGGKLGSGKSSAAKRIAQVLGWEHFSSGDFLREVARRRGMSIRELMIAAESDPSIDEEIDALLRKKGEEGDMLVIDSRLAFHWIPHSFKVFLEIDPELAAERMFADLSQNEERRSSEKAQTAREMLREMEERHASDRKRYARLYNIDHTDHSHFDLVIDTGKREHPLEKVVEMIICEYTKWFQAK